MTPVTSPHRGRVTRVEGLRDGFLIALAPAFDEDNAAARAVAAAIFEEIAHAYDDKVEVIVEWSAREVTLSGKVTIDGVALAPLQKLARGALDASGWEVVVP